MLRNQFPGNGHWHIPVIPKAHFADEEFRGLRLIGYDRTKQDDERLLERMVHFFLFPDKGIRVIPTVSWGDEDTFDFCFDGIPKGRTVAVSTYMVSAQEIMQIKRNFL